MPMKALVGTKIGMTQVFDPNGTVVPVTVLEAGPCVVTQVKTAERDGYQAIQVGFGEAKNQAKPQAGHVKESKSNPRVLKEFRLSQEASEDLKVGAKLDVTSFEVGESVRVTGTSKGKGFAGTIKRHNFSRGPKTHGSRNYRAPGSIGAGYPEHVFRGMRMAGRMGGERVTTRNLKVVLIDAERNLLGLRGAVPGPRKGIVVVRGQNG